MMWSENAGGWIELVEKSLGSSDTLYGKQIYISGIHESKKLLLVDNDTDNNYAIVSVDKKKSTYRCETIEIIFSIEALAEKMKKDHEQWLNCFKKC